MSDEQAEPAAGSSNRRQVLAGVGAAGAVAILGACGTEPQSTYEVPERTQPTGAATPTPSPESGDTEAGDGEEPAVGGLVAASDVEVGSGVILAEEDLVVTQPAEGQWRGFSATCTHQGCTVSTIENGTINCNCHGSQFSIEDGSVVTAAFGGDPGSQDPLPEVAVDVADGQVVRA